jgi:hypothetical protein
MSETDEHKSEERQLIQDDRPPGERRHQERTQASGIALAAMALIVGAGALLLLDNADVHPSWEGMSHGALTLHMGYQH